MDQKGSIPQVVFLLIHDLFRKKVSWGTSVSDLLNYMHWWNGPSYLQKGAVSLTADELENSKGT